MVEFAVASVRDLDHESDSAIGSGFHRSDSYSHQASVVSGDLRVAAAYIMLYPFRVGTLGWSHVAPASGAPILPNGDLDNTPATLTSLLLPTAVDVTSGGTNATFTAGASDAGSGVDYVLIRLDHSFRTSSGTQDYILLNDSADSYSDGLSSFSQYFSSQTPAGTYGIEYVATHDKAGNFRFYYPSEIAQMGLATSFQIIDRNAAVSASITAPMSALEGNTATIPLTLTLHNIAASSGTITLSFDAAQSTASNGIDVSVPHYSGSYTVSQSPAGDYTIVLPSIVVLDDNVAEGNETLAVRVTASGQIFESGTDSTIVTIQLRDNDFAGTSEDDLLAGTEGADTLIGAQGKDVLIGNEGNDNLTGNQGDDTLYGNQNDDMLYGGQGNDALYGGRDHDVLFGNLGDDVLNGNLGADMLQGDDGNDTLFGNEDDDVLFGNIGNDVLYGGRDQDSLYGGQGDDQLFGNLGDDLIQGGAGRDVMSGGAGSDIFRFVTAADSSLAAPDIIVDFENGIDRIDLRPLHASGADRFEIGVDDGGSFIDVDLGGDGSADLQIRVIAAAPLSTTDILWF